MSVPVVDPKRAETQINQRLSLRKPQSESLHRLADIVDLIAPSKDTEVEAAREAIRAAYGDLDDAYFEDFERDFPSVCFALATGVGKTRLMGAFVSYLFMTGKSRNFFVLAPNLTIYEKLLADFQPSSPKYVFKGVEAFAHQPPLIVNAENYEEGRGVRGADTDIVIHVNKLKEGWDVSNLFTIVPLRASASDILTEQTLGRGLRLPYGKRTGVDAVDTLTVIAHDRFNDLIEKAKDADGVIHSLKQVKIGEGGDVSASKPVMVEAPSVIEQMLKQVVRPPEDDVATEPHSNSPVNRL